MLLLLLDNNRNSGVVVETDLAEEKDIQALAK